MVERRCPPDEPVVVEAEDRSFESRRLLEAELVKVRDEEAQATSALQDAQRRRLTLIEKLRSAPQIVHQSRENSPFFSAGAGASSEAALEVDTKSAQQPNLENTAWLHALASPERRESNRTRPERHEFPFWVYASMCRFADGTEVKVPWSCTQAKISG